MLVDYDSYGKNTLMFLALQHFGGISGRIRIQKILYLADTIGWDAMNDYKYYYYGPYSQWLQTELESLVQNGILDEEVVDLGERVRYDYALTEEGQDYASELIEGFEDEELLAQTRIFLDAFRNFSSEELEVMATLVFMRRRNSELDDDALVDLVHRYKPRFSEEFIKRNLRVFDILREFQAA